MAEIADGAVNFRDEQGSWQPINNRLRTRSGGGFENTANGYRLHLPATLADPVRITKAFQPICH
jgi:hypothetical protein